LEAVVLIFFFIIYIVIRLLFSGKTQLEKDALSFQQGLNAFNNKNYEAARSYFTGIVATQPRSVLAWTILGSSYFHLNDFETSMACLEKACHIDNLAQTYFYKGRIYFEQKNFKQALVEFNKAVWFDRKLAIAYRFKGLTFILLSEEQNGIQALKDAVSYGDELSIPLLQKAKQSSSSI
jgi:tetratricopeptide (TPR) repeat protein